VTGPPEDPRGTDPAAIAQPIREAPGHDVVVVGASAGGVEALRRLIGALGDDFDATMFVVLHLPSNAHSVLPEILRRAGALPVQHARDGEVPLRGHVYVAPPDAHLLVGPGRMHLVRGPTDNGHRPAIDPLFRSAAESYGSRVIGVVLSGVLDDGTNGLRAIARHGGTTMAQSPEDALSPSMPNSAIHNVALDVVADVEGIGASVMAAARDGTASSPNALGNATGSGHGSEHRARDDVTERALTDAGALEMSGRPSRFTCPDCGGALWEAGADEPGKFRCRVGHAWSTLGLLEQQAVTLDQALWTALRALSERADLARRMRDDAAARGHEHGRQLFERQLEEYEAKAERVRPVLQTPEALVVTREEELVSAVGPGVPPSDGPEGGADRPQDAEGEPARATAETDPG